jgi:hypothetical protein
VAILASKPIASWDIADIVRAGVVDSSLGLITIIWIFPVMSGLFFLGALSPDFFLLLRKLLSPFLSNPYGNLRI